MTPNLLLLVLFIMGRHRSALLGRKLDYCRLCQEGVDWTAAVVT